MFTNPNKFKGKYRTQSNRLAGYNYSQEGAYFVTICCKDRECLFGEIVDKKMVLNELGRIAEECWKNIPDHFPNTKLDKFVIMPNHIHGIIFLSSNNNNPSTNVETKNFLSLRGGQCPHPGTSQTIGSIIRGFKIGVTKWARQNTDVFVVWQPNYYDRIVRDEGELNRIREYILNNPLKWESDKNNPENIFI